MKYIYYIIVIMMVCSGLAVYGLVDTRVEMSSPVLSINDRIISEDEFETMLKRKPSYMSRAQFIESVIDRQLLIQEAIRMKINTEESFRQSVENFYEQSLIKILLDRKLSSLVVAVTPDELAAYERLCQQTLSLTKQVYPSMKDAQAKTNETVEKINADFIDLSDDLKFIVLPLSPGESSNPRADAYGVSVYRLDDIQKKQPGDSVQAVDMKRVSLFIQDKKKEQRLDEWTRAIKASADIWRKK
ncbi:hypothetical protein [Desulfobacula sp.]|uniref:hypothetical protein n=1 Tax=Desulfobacula sp. TaxID=2593537 RepID=UPI00262E1A7D|nr:hypothetical protein [Desulfobacula sp.]